MKKIIEILPHLTIFIVQILITHEYGFQSYTPHFTNQHSYFIIQSIFAIQIYLKCFLVTFLTYCEQFYRDVLSKKYKLLNLPFLSQFSFITVNKCNIHGFINFYNLRFLSVASFIFNICFVHLWMKMLSEKYSFLGFCFLFKHCLDSNFFC